MLRTWLRMHQRWFGEEVPLLPLSPAKIEAVSAQMCQLRYRSFANYLAAAKKAHITSPLTNGR